jgi:hypothetical protein
MLWYDYCGTVEGWLELSFMGIGGTSFMQEEFVESCVPSFFHKGCMKVCI